MSRGLPFQNWKIINIINKIAQETLTLYDWGKIFIATRNDLVTAPAI